MSEIFMLDTDMEMPCPCKCGEWFDLHDGISGKNGQVYCSLNCSKLFEETKGNTQSCIFCDYVVSLENVVHGYYCSDACALEGNEGETLNVCNSCEEVFSLDSDMCDFCGSDDFETQEVLI